MCLTVNHWLTLVRLGMRLCSLSAFACSAWWPKGDRKWYLWKLQGYVLISVSWFYSYILREWLVWMRFREHETKSEVEINLGRTGVNLILYCRKLQPLRVSWDIIGSGGSYNLIFEEMLWLAGTFGLRAGNANPRVSPSVYFSSSEIDDRISTVLEGFDALSPCIFFSCLELES